MVAARFRIAKTDEDQRLVFGWASVAADRGGRQLVDQQGDMVDVDELEHVFRNEGSLLGVSHKSSMENLVTRVIITGKEKKGKVPVKATLDGDTRFGIIQEIVAKGSMSSAAARYEAQTILEERGKPEDTIRVSGPDVPDIVKGDRIKVVGGTLDGYFIVLAVQHDAKSRSLVMEIEKDG